MIVNYTKGGEKYTSAERPLNEYGIFIRNNSAVGIIKKVLAQVEPMMNTQVSSRKPFGLESNTAFDVKGDIMLRSNQGTGKINRKRITAGHDMIDKWKVIVSKVTFEHAGVPDKDGTMRVLSVIQILPPHSACTESYLIAGAYEDEQTCQNLVSYLKTKFARFLITPMLASMNMSKSSYSFVPIQDFSRPWTDAELYEKYGLTDEEISFIESMIRPME